MLVGRDARVSSAASPFGEPLSTHVGAPNERGAVTEGEAAIQRGLWFLPVGCLLADAVDATAAAAAV